MGVALIEERVSDLVSDPEAQPVTADLLTQRITARAPWLLWADVYADVQLPVSARKHQRLVPASIHREVSFRELEPSRDQQRRKVGGHGFPRAQAPNVLADSGRERDCFIKWRDPAERIRWPRPTFSLSTG